MLELGLIQRQLRLGPPVFAGVETIPVAQIIGTTSRARDFDGCFRPLLGREPKPKSQPALLLPLTDDEA